MAQVRRRILVAPYRRANRRADAPVRILAWATGVPVTAREMLRYAAYRFDCDGQPCGGGETCAKKPPCPDVVAALRTLAERLDEETRRARSKWRDTSSTACRNLLARLEADLETPAIPKPR